MRTSEHIDYMRGFINLRRNLFKPVPHVKVKDFTDALLDWLKDDVNKAKARKMTEKVFEQQIIGNFNGQVYTNNAERTNSYKEIL